MMINDIKKYKWIIFVIIMLCITMMKANAQPMIDEDITEVDRKHEIYRPSCPLTLEQQYFIYSECEKKRLSYEMILGVIQLESNFDADCISEGRDMGLMQINARYSDWYAELAGLDEYDVMEPYDNLKMGISGLAHYRDYCYKEGMSDEMAFVATLNFYNMGIQGFQNHVNSGKGITRAYDRIVYKYKTQFEMEAVK